jgi:hypothetical protein
MMREFLAGLKRWWLRRFRGIVAPPAQYGGQGTTWKQHGRDEWAFSCACRELLTFTEADYVIREQNHIEGCEGVEDFSTGAPATGSSKVIHLRPCSCPVTDARYIKICPNCRLGHWKEAIT